MATLHISEETITTHKEKNLDQRLHILNELTKLGQAKFVYAYDTDDIALCGAPICVKTLSSH